jgi:raffinose/stachyose/melibiose transport system permease protein
MVNKNRLVPFIFLAPAFLLLALFVYYPVVKNLIFSYYDWNPFQTEKKFIFFTNYLRLFKDPVFYIALKDNVLYAGISYLFQVCGGLILAAILEDKLFRRFAPFLRTIYFLPVLISMTVIGLLFGFVYSPESGLLNSFLNSIGLHSFTTGWLGNNKTAMIAVIAVSQWQSIGYTTMLYIVAIQKIPKELYEAATLDGANKVRSFFHITVPQVKEMIFVLSIYTVTGSFLVFNEVFVMTGGGPGYSSQVLSTYLYQKAFVDNEMGYASSIANIILVITLLFYFIQNKFIKTGEV